MLDRFRGRHILMLQGPNGFFFRNVARHLRRRGVHVVKINFNPGDTLFFHEGEVLSFRQPSPEWPGFMESVLRDRHIDVVMLFGDCRQHHRVAIEVAKRVGVEVYVFEEGYLRPDFVTLERDGVNGNSHIPRDPEFYRQLTATTLPGVVPVGPIFLRAAWYSGLYAFANSVWGWRVPHYRHHRDLNALRQAYYWGRSGVRKAFAYFRDRELNRRLMAGTMPPYFFVPLQVHLDSQIGHSKYQGIPEFITEVVESFAACAPRDCSLILKVHPFDRPYRDYRQLTGELARRTGLNGRLIYADVINLPATLRHARGTVVINSTVGLSSIQRGTPTLCLGHAVYDIPGLTHQGTLADFWRDPGQVDLELYRKLRYWLRTNNQLNGTVWGDIFPSPPAAERADREVPGKILGLTEDGP